MKLPDIAVVGGGLVGRMLAWRASRAGLKVSLYDSGGVLGEGSAAWVAAGMIAPVAEAIDADAEIVAMGRNSQALWPQWLAQLSLPVFYRDKGTVLVWHLDAEGEAWHFQATLASHNAQASLLRIDAARLGELEPSLGGRFRQALYIPNEAQVDNRGLLKSVALALEEENVECHWNTFFAQDMRLNADVTVDCRGMGAKDAWPQLRGVRGEILRLHAPEIELHHMLRLIHPRYPVYVVPRAEGRLIVGATSVESDDGSSISVRGVLDLLSSACSVLPALAEARILEFATQVRPVLPDNGPALQFDRERRILRINGLYRHGFLLSPTVVEEALALLKCGTTTGRWPGLFAAPAGLSTSSPFSPGRMESVSTV